MGKITVKHYLNKRVKPEYLDSEDEKTGAEYYPLSYSITVNRKTIHRQSQLSKTYSKETFETNLDLKENIKKETILLNRIIDIFLLDLEKNQVNKEYKYLTKKKYNANDEILNSLNAYIDYYTNHVFGIVCDFVDREIDKYLKEKAEKNFDLSMLKNFQKDIFVININNLIGSVEAEFIYKNTNEQIIKLYVLRHLMQRGLAKYANKYLYDYPLIDMGNETIINFLREFANERKTDFYLLDQFKITDELLTEYENTLKYITSWEYMNNKYLKF